MWSFVGSLGLFYLIYKKTRLNANKLLIEFSSDFPDVGKIAGQSPLILVTADEFVELPRPIHHNVVYIGGLGLDTAGESLKLGPEFEVRLICLY